MTYQKLTEELRLVLESHAQIRKVIFDTPQEWMFKGQKPDLPIACYRINSGSFEPGQKIFNVDFWFLDKSGRDGEFDIEVSSDMTEVANDIVAMLKQSHIRDWTVGENVQFSIINDSFEDYLSGCRLTVQIKTVNKYDACSIPIID